MAKLSDLHLASLLEEIASSMKGGIPIVDSMRRLSDRRIGPVGRASGAIATAMDRGESLPHAIQHSNFPIAMEAAATVQVCQEGGDPSLLTSMAGLLRSRYKHRQATRFAWLYPIILLIVAYMACAFIMVPLVIENQSADLAWPTGVVALCHWLDRYWMVPLIAFATVFIPLVLMFGNKRELPENVRAHLFCRSLVDQIKRGVPEGEAIQQAGSISGDSRFATANMTLQSPEVVAWLDRAPQQITGLVDAAPEQTIVAKLDYVAVEFEQRAKAHDYFWARIVPRVAMVVLGSGVTLAYVFWFITPVYRQVGQW